MITPVPIKGEQTVGCPTCMVKWFGEIDSPCWVCEGPGHSVWGTKTLATSPVGEYRSGTSDA